MKVRILIALAAAVVVAGCEKERSVGFTGIGNEPSQARTSSYALDFNGLVPKDASSATQSSGRKSSQ